MEVSDGGRDQCKKGPGKSRWNKVKKKGVHWGTSKKKKRVGTRKTQISQGQMGGIEATSKGTKSTFPGPILKDEGGDGNCKAEESPCMGIKCPKTACT